MPLGIGWIMVHYSRRRRHGLQPHEFYPVFEAVKHKLFELVDARCNFTEAEALFKVLFRFENCKPGRPEYPEVINWQFITDYINGPFSPFPELMDDVVEGGPT